MSLKITYILNSPSRGDVEITADFSNLKTYEYDEEIRNFLHLTICARIAVRQEEERVNAYKNPKPQEDLCDYLSRTEEEEGISPVMVV